MQAFRPLAFAIAGLSAVTVLVLAARSSPAGALTAPDFSMAVQGGACHPSGAGADCDIDPFSTFTLGVLLNKTNMPAYWGFQVKLTSPLVYTNRPAQQEIVWPGCEISYDDTTQPPAYLAGCLRSLSSSGSTFLGKVLEVDYTCGASSGLIYTITMLQGSSTDSSYLLDQTYNFVDPEGGASETLTVRCHALPTPTPAVVGGIAELPQLAAHPAAHSRRAIEFSLGLASGCAAVATGSALWLRRRRR